MLVTGRSDIVSTVLQVRPGHGQLGHEREEPGAGLVRPHPVERRTRGRQGISESPDVAHERPQTRQRPARLRHQDHRHGPLPQDLRGGHEEIGQVGKRIPASGLSTFRFYPLKTIDEAIHISVIYTTSQLTPKWLLQTSSISLNFITFRSSPPSIP